MPGTRKGTRKRTRKRKIGGAPEEGYDFNSLTKDDILKEMRENLKNAPPPKQEVPQSRNKSTVKRDALRKLKMLYFLKENKSLSKPRTK